MAHAPSLPNIINSTQLARGRVFTIFSDHTGTTLTCTQTRRTITATDRFGNEYLDCIALSPTTTPTVNINRVPHLPTTTDFEAWLATATTDEQLNKLRDTTSPPNRSERDAIRTQLAYTGTLTVDNERDEVMKWHHILGHRSPEQTVTFLRQQGIKLSKYANIFCDSCNQQKLRRAARPNHNLNHPSGRNWRPLELWSCDISGPKPPSRFHKHRYVLAFRDHATKTTILIFTPDPPAEEK